MRKSGSGFTIVELLIVIVVVGILASITVVAYNGVRNRAQDSQRLSNAAGIVKGLKLYYAQNGSYPSPTSSSNDDDWERSGVEPAGQFMEYLANYGFSGGAPIDPVNNATTSDSTGPGNPKSLGQYGYYYYRYGPGDYGCDGSRGSFFVFGITTFKSVTGNHPQSPGFSCSARNWQNEFSWVTGGFEN